MGEGILKFGLNARPRYKRDLQSFANEVLRRGNANNSLYIFSKSSKDIVSQLRKQGYDVADKVAIVDKTITKYRTHPKREKGAVVGFDRFVMVEKAVKHPKNIYIDKKRKRLVFVTSVKYAPKKILKVVVDPNQRMREGVFNKVVSIGVVDKINMGNGQYTKIK